jgi:hypothetical protein
MSKPELTIVESGDTPKRRKLFGTGPATKGRWGSKTEPHSRRGSDVGPTEGESVVRAAQFKYSRRESPRSGGSPVGAKPEGHRQGVERAQIHGGAIQALHARS